MEFSIEGKEKTKELAFLKKHEKCRCTATTGGKFTYAFTPTGIGIYVMIRCNVCCVSKDLTDTSDW